MKEDTHLVRETLQLVHSVYGSAVVGETSSIHPAIVAARIVIIAFWVVIMANMVSQMQGAFSDEENCLQFVTGCYRVYNLLSHILCSIVCWRNQKRLRRMIDETRPLINKSKHLLAAVLFSVAGMTYVIRFLFAILRQDDILTIVSESVYVFVKVYWEVCIVSISFIATSIADGFCNLGLRIQVLSRSDVESDDQLWRNACSERQNLRQRIRNLNATFGAIVFLLILKMLYMILEICRLVILPVSRYWYFSKSLGIISFCLELYMLMAAGDELLTCGRNIEASICDMAVLKMNSSPLNAMQQNVFHTDPEQDTLRIASAIPLTRATVLKAILLFSILGTCTLQLDAQIRTGLGLQRIAYRYSGNFSNPEARYF